MVKIISFDLDGTITKSTYADIVWLEGLPKIYAQEKGIKIQLAIQYLKKEYDKIGENKAEWYDLEYWFNRFNIHYKWKKLLEDYRHAIEIYPEVPSVLRRLFKQFDLIIISNAKREFIEIQLEEIKLREYFTLVFSSISDFNKIKKVSDFYLMICKKIGINPNEMIHIGDHKEFDYQIPKNIGIKSYYLNRKKTTKEEFMVNDLNEFEQIINTQFSATNK
jgi:putative hydrolase of the HAD superfamily